MGTHGFTPTGRTIHGVAPIAEQCGRLLIPSRCRWNATHPGSLSREPGDAERHNLKPIGDGSTEWGRNERQPGAAFWRRGVAVRAAPAAGARRAHPGDD